MRDVLFAVRLVLRQSQTRITCVHTCCEGVTLIKQGRQHESMHVDEMSDLLTKVSGRVFEECMRIVSDSNEARFNGDNSLLDEIWDVLRARKP